MDTVVRKLAAATLLAVLIITRNAQPVLAGAGYQARATQVIAASVPADAQWSLTVVDLSRGETAAEAGTAPVQGMIPGSLVKLLTTGAIIDAAASHAAPGLRTTLSRDGSMRGDRLLGNLYLTGRGNALLTTPDLTRLAAAVSRDGIRQVEGDIVVDASLLDARGLERKRPGAAQAPPGALGLDLHTVAVTVQGTTAGKAPTVAVEPANDEVRFANEALTVALPTVPLRVTPLGDHSFRVTGQIGPRGKFRTRMPLNDPAGYAGGALRTLLEKAGIQVSGRIRAGITPADAIHLADTAPDLDLLLSGMNAGSLNVVADTLFLVLGGERFGYPGTTEKGRRAVQQFMERMEIPAPSTVISDGSGLDEANRLSAGFFARYLYKAACTPWFDRFYGTLAKAGGDGILRDYPVLEGFRVKTGNLEKAYGIAGYGVDRGGRKLAFCFIINHPGCGVLDMRKAGAAVMKFLATEDLS